MFGVVFTLHVEGMALCFVAVKTSNAILILDSLYMVFSPFLSVFMNFFVFSVLKFQSYALMLPFYLFSGFMVCSFSLEIHVSQF